MDDEATASERYVPGEMRGSVVEAQHLARYRWAARLAAGRKVLDAGCGTAYGCRILAEAGAASVVGVDVAEAVLDVARPEMPGSVTLEAGSLERLPFEDGSFDLAICFEAIEHVADHGRALDELRRVLGDDGLLAISSPDPRVHPPGNPHHVRELEAEELDAVLGTRFAATRLYRQNDWILAAVGEEQALSLAGPAGEIEVHLAVPQRLSEFALALAGPAPLPRPGPVAVATGTVDFRAWLEQSRALEEVNRRQRARIAELEQAERDLLDCGRMLLRAESEGREVLESRSWRITAPLRAAAALRRSRRRDVESHD